MHLVDELERAHALVRCADASAPRDVARISPGFRKAQHVGNEAERARRP